MEPWKQDNRQEIAIIDIDRLVPKDHLLRKVEKVTDYEWIYEKLDSYYCHTNDRHGTDPVVLIKMVLLQHLFGISSLRQTYERCQDTVSYRWFLGYSLLDNVPLHTDDKLIQEVIRMILEAIYEPTFKDNSHGFRPKRSCHTALKEVIALFTGAKWIIEGDIKACFECVPTSKSDEIGGL